MLTVASSSHLFAALLAALLSGEPQQSKWDFEKDAIGEKPAGFSCGATRKAPPGKWQVVEDEGERVLAQTDQTREKWRYALAVVDDTSLKDVKLSVRVKAIKGDLDQGGGLVWRYRDPENYLVARLDVADRDVRLFRVADGNTTPFGIKQDVDLKPGQWYTLRVDHKGCDIKVYLDEDIMIMKHEKHFERSGKIGLWTKSDSVMHFDDLKVKQLQSDGPQGDAKGKSKGN
jgi:hypothetical protein